MNGGKRSLHEGRVCSVRCGVHVDEAPDDPAMNFVDALIAPDTLTTHCEATLDAFNTDGTAARTIDEGIEFANQVSVELVEIGSPWTASHSASDVWCHQFYRIVQYLDRHAA